METPFTDHLTQKDYEHVYEPAQDTFLLLDALEADLMFLKQLEPTVCLEIGSGSGVIITALAKKFPNAICMATDINIYACKATKRTASRNAANVDIVRSNLVDALRPHTIDLLIFNPPYVVTTEEELLQHDFNNFQNRTTTDNLIYTWAGGQNGRRVIDELIKKLNKILSPQGVFYLLLLRENRPEQVMNELNNLNFDALIFMERRIPGEYLYILKVTRK